MKNLASTSFPIRIEESLGSAFRPKDLLPDYDPTVLHEHPEVTAREWLDPSSGNLTSSVHSWIFQADGRTVLVDTCAGRRKSDPTTAPFLVNLQSSGIVGEEIDVVFLTHLHTDHMRWTTVKVDDEWRPTFPNARYIVGRRELAHWSPGGAGLALYPEQQPIIEEAITPLLNAGLVDLIEDDAVISPSLKTQPAPGHTATQLALSLSRPDAPYMFAADSFHHPIQIIRPDWGSCFCEDQDKARATRLRLLTECADTGAILMPSHFGSPHAVRILRTSRGFGFEPVRPDRRPAA